MVFRPFPTNFTTGLTPKAYLIFIVLWEIIVYYPLAFAIWGKGVLSPTGNVFSGIESHLAVDVMALTR